MNRAAKSEKKKGDQRAHGEQANSNVVAALLHGSASFDRMRTSKIVRKGG
jgi:hypothetical protein